MYKTLQTSSDISGVQSLSEALLRVSAMVSNEHFIKCIAKAYFCKRNKKRCIRGGALCSDFLKMDCRGRCSL